MPPTYATTGARERLTWPFRNAAGRYAVGWLAAADLVLGLTWLGAAQLFLVMPPAAGLAWTTAVCSLFLRRYTGAEARVTGRRGVSTRPALGESSLPLAAGAAVTFACFGQLWHVVYQRLPWISSPPRAIWDVYATSPMGLLAVTMFIVAAAPVVEEVCYRGWVMSAIRTRYGPAPAIAGSALLFALLHGRVSWIAYYLVAGLILGVAVDRSRSVWTGVLMHATYNATCVVVDAISPTRDAVEVWLHRSPAGEWAAPLALGVAGPALFLLIRRMASRAPRTAA